MNRDKLSRAPAFEEEVHNKSDPLTPLPKVRSGSGGHDAILHVSAAPGCAAASRWAVLLCRKTARKYSPKARGQPQP